ncbi:inorganic triphosphatase, partial [Escherichia coli]|nr:inorganic triphosphatase [Escherichia coli]
LLTQCEAPIASAGSAVTAVYSTERVMAKPAMTVRLVSNARQPFFDGKAQRKNSASVTSVPDTPPSRHAAALKSVFCQPCR